MFRFLQSSNQTHHVLFIDSKCRKVEIFICLVESFENLLADKETMYKKKDSLKEKEISFFFGHSCKMKENDEVQITLQRNAELLQTLTIKNAISFFSRVSLLFS